MKISLQIQNKVKNIQNYWEKWNNVLLSYSLFFILFLLLYSVIHLTFSLFFFAACDRQWIIGVKNSAPERGHWGRHCPGFTTGNKQSPIIPQGPIKSPTERKRYPTFQVRHIFIFPFPLFFSHLCPWLRFDFFLRNNESRQLLKN